LEASSDIDFSKWGYKGINLGGDVMKIPYYNGNIQNSICQGYVGLDRFVEANREPLPDASALLDKINQASLDGDKELKMKLKRNLPYFTPSIVFEVGAKRRYDNIKSFNGVVQLDFDDEQRAKDLKAYLWSTFDQLYCTYLSPSGKGVKALMRIPIVETVNQYKEYFLNIEEHFLGIGIDSFDHCGYNPIQPLYLSHDADILHRKNPDTWTEKTIPKTHEELENYVCKAPLNTIIGGEDVYKSQAYYRKISIDIFVKKVENIVGEPGHTRFRDACIVLGSRVGAGYIDMHDALMIAKHELERNAYLQKNLKGYWETGSSRIRLGSQSPRYYN